jgi:hypothetical protein
MTDYIKTEALFGKKDTVTIQPVTKEGLEQFALWDNFERKMYQEGSEVEVDKEMKKVNRYIKLSDEQKKRYRRVLKVQREIVVNGKPFTYGMPPSMDKKLLTVMETVEKMGKNPLFFNYQVIRKKTGNAAIDIEYDVILGGENSPSTDLDVNIEGETTDEIVLDETETKMVEAVKKKYQNYASIPVEKLVDAFGRTLKTPSYRAALIVNKYLRN